MKVLYVHDRFSGGAGESLYHVVRGRQAHGQSIIVVGADGFVGDRFRRLHLDPPPIYQRAHSWVVMRWPARRVLSLLWRVLVAPMHLPLLFRVLRVARRHHVDVIHTNCIYLMEGALAAKVLGLPHVWQVRELVDLDYYQYALPKGVVMNCLHRLADVILCNSQRTAEGVRRAGAPPDKIRVIANIVDAPPAHEDLRSVLGLDSDVLLVGTVGWISRNKRVEDFIALASVPGGWDPKVRFVIIGGWGGDAEYNARIARAIAESPNRASIIHTGVLKDAARYMASLDVLVCPCFTESFGRTVAEALASGTPAIAVRSSAAAEIVDHGKTGFLVSEGDVAAMAEYTRALLADPGQRRSFGALGKNTVEARFGSAVLLPRLEAMYREVRGRRGRGEPVTPARESVGI
jgi:glycosyltransferase involved in cell wall biosynthesis